MRLAYNRRSRSILDVLTEQVARLNTLLALLMVLGLVTNIARLLLEAGIPGDVLNLLPGSGETVGAALVADSRIAGVAFTGSTETARAINQSLAQRPGPIVPLIAETGGQNALIVDSSALAEQVVADVLGSAFDSAGQRCSALRILCLQDDIADRTLTMLKAAMRELSRHQSVRDDADRMAASAR